MLNHGLKCFITSKETTKLKTLTRSSRYMKLIRELLVGEKHITDYIEHIYELDTEIKVGYHVNTRYSVRVLYSTR